MDDAATDPVGGGRDRDGDAAGAGRSERDYGDSAGYGGGGSTLDYDELLGDESSPRDLGRPNPLDAVVHTGGEEGESEADDGSPPNPAKPTGGEGR